MKGACSTSCATPHALLDMRDRRSSRVCTSDEASGLKASKAALLRARLAGAAPKGSASGSCTSESDSMQYWSLQLVQDAPYACITRSPAVVRGLADPTSARERWNRHLQPTIGVHPPNRTSVAAALYEQIVLPCSTLCRCQQYHRVCDRVCRLRCMHPCMTPSMEPWTVYGLATGAVRGLIALCKRESTLNCKRDGRDGG
jgi:hypothetical protein